MNTTARSEPTKRTFQHVVESEVSLAGWCMGEGLTVLLLHAGGERCDVWEPVASTLVNQHDVRCVAVDQRGHGSSGGLGVSLDVFGADVASLLEGIRGPILAVGSSLGGLAIINALRFQNVRELVAGIVLVDVVPDPNPARAHEYLKNRSVGRRNRALVENILGAGGTQGELLKRAQTPALLVRATRSPALNDTDAARLAGLTSDLTTVVVDSGHLVSQDAPDELATAIGVAIETWLVA